MLLNADHRPWLIATAAATAAATAGYVVYARSEPYGPSGGSWPGLAFGVAGTVCMVVPALLAARKKVRTLRIGSAQLWMKLHIWLSLLAVPLIWFHSGFGWGGPLTTTLMALFYVVTLSGIFGLIVQQFVPAMLTARVPLEALSSQLDRVLEGLRLSAYEIVASVTGPLVEAAEEQQALAAEEARQKARPGDWKAVTRLRAAPAPEAGAEILRGFYLREIRPFLLDRRRRVAPDLRVLRAECPAEWQGKVEHLAQICEEARQLALQERLHRLLHGWLFVHAPLSLLLLVLAAFHAVFALRY